MGVNSNPCGDVRVDAANEGYLKTVAFLAQEKALSDDIHTQGDDGINDATQAAIDAVCATVNALAKSARDAIQSLNSLVIGSFDATAGLIAGLINALKDQSNEQTNLAEQGIKDAVRQAQTASEAMVGALEQGAREMHNDTMDAVGRITQNTTNSINDVVQGALGATNSLIGSLAQGMANQSNAIIEANRQQTEAMSQGIKDVVGGITGMIGGISGSLESGVGAHIDHLGITIGKMDSDLTSGVRTAAGQVSGWLSDAWNIATSSIGGAVNLFAGSVEGAYHDTVGFLGSLLEKLASWWASNMATLPEKINQACHAAVNAVGALLSGNCTSAKDIVGFLTLAGVNDSFVTCFFKLVMGVGVLITAMPSAMSPFLKNISNCFNIIALSGTLGGETAAGLVARGWMSYNDAMTEGAKQGLSSPKMEALVQASFGTLTPDILIAGIRRGALNAQDQEYYAGHMGYTMATIRAMDRSTRPLLGSGDIAAGFFRGTIDETRVISEFAGQGLTEERALVVLDNHRPLLSPDIIKQNYLRGEIDEDTHDHMMRMHGFEQEQLSFIKTLYKSIPGPADLIRMAVKEAFSPEIAERFGQYDDYPTQFSEHAKHIGVDEEWAKRYWAAHWELPSATMGFEMLHRGIIDHKDLDLLLRAQDVMPFWRDKVVQVAYNPLTRVDVRRMYRMGVLSDEDVYKSYKDLGYDDKNARRLAEFTKRYETPEASDEQSKIRELSQAMVLKAYKRGIITREDAQSHLLSLHYRSEDSDLLLALVDYDTVSDIEPNNRAEIFKAHRDMIRRAYQKHVISAEEAVYELQGLGYSPVNAALEVDVIDLAYSEQVSEKYLAKIYEMYRNNLIDDAGIGELLGQRGYTAGQIDFIMSDIRIDTLNTKIPTETDMKAMYKRGIIREEEYSASLRAHGYADEWIDALMMLNAP